MGASKKKILFVSHNATRTGAPHVLLGIIRGFRQVGGWDIQIISKENGPLVEEFRSLGETFVWYKEPSYLIVSKKKMSRFLTRAYYKIRGLIILRRINQADVIFLNTITNGLLHKKLAKKSKLFFTYVHELGISIKANTNSESLDQVLRGTNFFLAASEAVAKLLKERFGVEENKMLVLYESILNTSNQKEDYRSGRLDFRYKNHIPDGAFVIGILGTGEWRKGFDWLFPVVKLYFKKFPTGNAIFVWKGISTLVSEGINIVFDLEKSKLSDKVILLPHGDDAMGILAHFDVHLLLAREDPFPLAVLEAASFAIPTICFNEAGGIPEFVKDDAGICVDYGDFDAVVDAIIHLEQNRSLLDQLGIKAKEKLSEYSSEKASKTIINLIGQLGK